MLFANESVINDIKNLGINFVSNQEDFNISVVLMCFIHSVSWNDSKNV